MNNNSTDSISPMNNSGINGQTSTPPSSPPSSMGFYVKAKKSLESKLKLKARREEARRMKTPPLAEDTTSGRPRSFFTETVPPTEADQMEPPSRRNSLQTVRRQSIVADTYEWWEKMPKKPVRRSPFQERIPFEFQLPEHLPSSPMCPTNEKHVSGGAGICVYHGRRKGASRLLPV
ncbi:hypothetical protein ACKRZS_004846 [Fusarium odoratissimum]